MFSIYSQIRRNIKTKSYKLTIFEIVIFGALLAIYILTAYIENFLFPRGFRLSITYAIFIIFGLALGPWKGAFLGLLSDTLNQVIYGVSTWMIEYAIIPPIIAFLSGMCLQLAYLNPHKFWTYTFLILTFVTFLIIFFVVKNINHISWKEFSRKLKKTQILPIRIVATIISVGLGSIWLFSLILLVTHLKTKSFKTKWKTQLMFSILITTFIILIITRWLWGPFAYISYMNRFRNMNWKYADYFTIFMIPIVFKSLIEIPVYTVIIYAVMPIINIAKQKISFYKNKIFTY
ncbi:ECF transporter S component [Metamycoplasma salivarium]|uniref:ECF transporter S component n=1 Tax=Metamycoplasma salivarium TaxID=2124 RepID=UPI0035BC5A13